MKFAICYKGTRNSLWPEWFDSEEDVVNRLLMLPNLVEYLEVVDDDNLVKAEYS